MPCRVAASPKVVTGPADRPQPETGQARGGPLVSVIMANFQAGAKLVPALRSVLGQTMSDLEVIVSDDASQDNSLELVRSMMQADARIRLIAHETNRGPAHCRNRALDMARGSWMAVVDSDDILHPERFERLLAAADEFAADMVADNLLLFHEDGSRPGLMLEAQDAGSFVISPRDWVLAGLDGSPALGYLKPMIRTDRLAGRRYDEKLRIGEDYDLVLRLLLAEARMVVIREPFYLYRRHSASISHRLSVRDMQAMVDRQAALAALHEPLPTELSAAFARRQASLQAGLSYEQLVASIKSRHVLQTLRLLGANPRHVSRLARSLIEGRRRRPGRPAAPSPTGTVVLGARGIPGASHEVPDYVPAHRVDWSAKAPHPLWRDLASYAGSRCVALDLAGRYAAGFIPEVELEAQAAPLEAS